MLDLATFCGLIRFFVGVLLWVTLILGLGVRCGLVFYF